MISCGEAHVLTISNNQVLGWGNNKQYQLGLDQ